MRAIRAILKWVDRVTGWLAAFALVGTFALVFLNVILRYLFGTGFAWSEEGARYALMAVIILGVLEVTHSREHFCVDLLTQTAPKPVLRVMEVIQNLLMLAVMAVLANGSWKMTLLNWENTTPAIGMPSWLPYGLMLVSSVISLVYLLGHLLGSLGLRLDEAEEGGGEPC